MKSVVNPSEIVGTWNRVNTNYGSSHVKFEREGQKIVYCDSTKRASGKAPNKYLTYNSNYLTGLFYESSSSSIVKYRADLSQSGGGRIPIYVYLTSNDLTITER